MHPGSAILSLSVSLDGLLVSGSASGQVTVCRRHSGAPATLITMPTVTTQVRNAICDGRWRIQKVLKRTLEQIEGLPRRSR